MASPMQQTAMLDLLTATPGTVKHASAIQKAAFQDAIGMEKEALLPLVIPAVFGALSAWDTAKGLYGVATGRKGAWGDLGMGVVGLATLGMGGAALKGARLLKGVAAGGGRFAGAAQAARSGLQGFYKAIKPLEAVTNAIGKPVTRAAGHIGLDKIPLVGQMMFGKGRGTNMMMGGTAIGLGASALGSLFGGGGGGKGGSGGPGGGGPGGMGAPYQPPQSQEIKNVAPTPSFAPPIQPQPLTPQPYQNQTQPQKPPEPFSASSPGSAGTSSEQPGQGE